MKNSTLLSAALTGMTSAALLGITSTALTFITHTSLKTSHVNQFERFAESQVTQDHFVAHNSCGAGNNNQSKH